MSTWSLEVYLGPGQRKKMEQTAKKVAQLLDSPVIITKTHHDIAIDMETGRVAYDASYTELRVTLHPEDK